MSVPSRVATRRRSPAPSGTRSAAARAATSPSGPDNPDIVYAGELPGLPDALRPRTRPGAQHHASGPRRASGWGAKDVKYRFQWTSPIVLSPHDPNIALHGGNRVFRSRDEGADLGGDQPRPDAQRPEHAGALRRADHQGQHRRRGLRHRLRARRVAARARASSGPARTTGWSTSRATAARPGRTSRRRTCRTWALISHHRGRRRTTPAPPTSPRTRYKLDDFAPYLYKTTDYGADLDEDHRRASPTTTSRASIREDPARRGLLYAGTETGVYVSFDDGAQLAAGSAATCRSCRSTTWSSRTTTSSSARTAARSGSSTTSRRCGSTRVEAGRAVLFEPKPSRSATARHGLPAAAEDRQELPHDRRDDGHLSPAREADGREGPINIDAGTNPPSGVLVQYWLRDKAKAEVTLAFLDARGKLIREFKSDPKALDEELKPEEAPEKTPPEGTVQPPPTKDPKVAVQAGLNRFLWNMRYPDAAKIEGEGGTWEAFEAQLAGPQVPPGSLPRAAQGRGRNARGAVRDPQGPARLHAAAGLRDADRARAEGQPEAGRDASDDQRDPPPQDAARRVGSAREGAGRAGAPREGRRVTATEGERDRSRARAGQGEEPPGHAQLSREAQREAASPRRLHRRCRLRADHRHARGLRGRARSVSMRRSRSGTRS